MAASGTHKQNSRVLHRAITAGQLTTVQSLLTTHDIDVNCKYNRTSPLRRAVQLGLEDIAALLIQHNADVCEVDDSGCTLLHTAVCHPHLIPLLVEAGVNVDTTDFTGTTPISLAVSTSNTDTLSAFIAANADLNRCNSQGDSPLMLAIESRDEKVVRTLLESNQCDVNLRDNEMKTALIIAVEKRYSEMVSLLLSAGCDLDAADMHGRTALLFAAKQGCADMVEQLLDAGANFDKADSTKCSPFTVSICAKDMDIASILASSGCDVNLCDRDMDQAPIHHAIRLAHGDTSDSRLSSVRLLLCFGCDVNVSDKHGCSPIYQAALAGDAELVRLLLEHDICTSVETSSGDSALHGAVFGNDPQVMRMLLDAGCNVNAVNQRNELPLYNAVERRTNIELVRMLVDAGSELEVCERSKGKSALFAAIGSDYNEAVDVLMKAGADVNRPNADGDTPLWVACNRGNKLVVAALLSRDDIIVDRGIGHIPLHAAVLGGHNDIIKQLLRAGCDVNKLTDLGASALYFAATVNRVPIIRLLISHGADPCASLTPPRACCRHYSDAHPHLELSPFYAAVQNDNPAVLSLLWSATLRPPYSTVVTLRDLVFRTGYAREARVNPAVLHAFASFFAMTLSAPKRLLVLAFGEVRRLLNGRSVDCLPLPDALKLKIKAQCDRRQIK